MIKRISICPFDLGYEITGLDRHDLKKLDLDLLLFEAEEAFVSGSDWVSLILEGYPVYIRKSGFGVIVFKEEIQCEIDAKSVTACLRSRRNTHCLIVEGEHSVCELIEKLRSEFLVYKDRSDRPLLWKFSPYVFSFYSILIETYPISENSGLMKTVAALTEPSIVQAEDTPGQQFDFEEETVEAKIARLDNVNICDVLVDCNIGSTTSTYISWASMTICSNDLGELNKVSREVTALEIRLQCAWITTHYINCWKNIALNDPKPSLNADKLRWELVKLDESTETILNASISSRLKVIWDKLLATSGYREEKEKASRGILLVREYAEFIRSKQERLYRNIVEVCIFLFAVSGLIPLIMQPPLIMLPKWFLIPFFVFFLLIIGLRLWRSK